MDRLDLKFLMLGAAMLVVGVGMGIYMAVTHDFQLSPVHAHVNLVGWVSLSLFGIVYRLFPELQPRRLARVHFLLAAPAAIMFPPGIVLAVLLQNPLMAIVAALMWFAGAVLFLVQLLGLALGRASAPALVPAE
jgi:cbb3-type cytochrome oxidase subunit 1